MKHMCIIKINIFFILFFSFISEYKIIEFSLDGHCMLIVILMLCMKAKVKIMTQSSK